jgi:hypothetical protein
MDVTKRARHSGVPFLIRLGDRSVRKRRKGNVTVGGSVTSSKIHGVNAERKYSEGNKWWLQTPSFSSYHISNIQCIVVQ